jgi:hypothetical protein
MCSTSERRSWAILDGSQPCHAAHLAKLTQRVYPGDVVLRKCHNLVCKCKRVRQQIQLQQGADAPDEHKDSNGACFRERLPPDAGVLAHLLGIRVDVASSTFLVLRRNDLLTCASDLRQLLDFIRLGSWNLRVRTCTLLWNLVAVRAAAVNVRECMAGDTEASIFKLQ